MCVCKGVRVQVQLMHSVEIIGLNKLYMASSEPMMRLYSLYQCCMDCFFNTSDRGKSMHH